MKAPTIDDELKSCKIIFKAATIDDVLKSCKIMLKAPTSDDELKSCKIILKAATIDDESKSCKIMLKGGGEARSVKWSHEQTSIDLLDIIIDPAGLWRSAQGRKWTALS